MKILITGGGGQLAHDLKRVFSKEEVFAPRREELDITRHKSVAEVVGVFRPDVVINTAAFHKVDMCEEEPEKAFAVNALAVRHLARLSDQFGFILVHISTDYVFGGEKRSPYVEEDSPMPLSVYANSKLAGEYFVRSCASRYYIIRTCGLFGIRGKFTRHSNFVERMLRAAREGKKLRIVNDQWVSPTYTLELAEHIKAILDNKVDYGIYHASSEGECTWYQFAMKIFEYAGIEAEAEAVTAEEFAAPARRPAYSVLENRKLRQAGLNRFSSWDEALRKYMQEAGYILP